MVTRLKKWEQGGQAELARHSWFKSFLKKLQKDNIGMLAGYLSWNIITSIIPIIVGLVAISAFFVRSPSAQATVISHLQSALQGAFSTSEIHSIVRASTQHAGLLGIIGLIGVLWGGSNVGGALSTTFQAIFEVNGRNFIKEKLIDIGMIFVFTALMLVIIAATSAGAILNHLISGFPVTGLTAFVVGTVISVLAGFLLFATIYMAFPNIEPRFRLQKVWRGALLSAVLFQILTYIWPLYAKFSNFHKYGAVLASMLILIAWIYFFSLICLIGAEVVGVSAIREANREGRSVGPPTQGTVPQHEVLRGQSEAS